MLDLFFPRFFRLNFHMLVFYLALLASFVTSFVRPIL